jgi:hypothetical protein
MTVGLLATKRCRVKLYLWEMTPAGHDPRKVTHHLAASVEVVTNNRQKGTCRPQEWNVKCQLR